MLSRTGAMLRVDFT